MTNKSLKKYCVLVVEDELLIAWDIMFLLEEAGYKVIIAKDYDIATTQFLNVVPDIVLIDVHLGKGKNGIELAHYIREEIKLPFIFLTSYNDRKTLDELLLTSPSGFIAKPFKKIDLLTSIQIALNTYSKKNNLQLHKSSINDVTYVIKKVLKYIDENIETKIEIDDLVKQTKWSKNHFIRIFTSQIGVSPYNYILKMKIEFAKRMILSEPDKLECIAYDLGFQSYVNFARTFKNYTKLSPKEFKKLNENTF